MGEMEGRGAGAEIAALLAERAAIEADALRLHARLEEINARIRESCSAGELTGREAQVLRLVLEGLQNKEIAERLHVGLRTVKFHVSNILAKTGARGRRELMAGKRERER